MAFNLLQHNVKRQDNQSNLPATRRVGDNDGSHRSNDWPKEWNDLEDTGNHAER